MADLGFPTRGDQSRRDMGSQPFILANYNPLPPSENESVVNRRIHVPCDSMRFGTKCTHGSIVVNGNHMEFHLYFSIFLKTRYLIHLTICNEHILNTLAQNHNLITHFMHNFDSFFHLFQSNWQIHYYK